VTDPVREGKYALRIDGTNAARRGDRDRIEFQHQPAPPGTAEGTERYFGWSVFVPQKLSADSHAVGYFETRNSWRQLLAFHVKGEDIEFTTRVPYARHWTGKGKFTAGRWHDFAVHVLWSRDAEKGFVEVWFDGEQVVPRVKTATLLDENVAFFQLGLIRLTAEIPETIIIDHVVEATTLKEVTPPRLAESRRTAAVLRKRLEEYYNPPVEYRDNFGDYRSPLQVETGKRVKSAEEWKSRRADILQTWHRRLGAWPPLVDKPVMKRLETVKRDGFTQYKVEFPVTSDGEILHAYLLVPPGEGPFPAVVVPFYEPFTSIGLGKKGHGTHDYGLQLVRRGFVTLSIAAPGGLLSIGVDEQQRKLPPDERVRPQPLTVLAYVAANSHSALAMLPEVDGDRIGIIGLSYGGKWAMFASCLHEKFACAVWSDPGIVFNEKNANANYWEPWYLGHDPSTKRKPGIPSTDKPRTGLYKELVDAGDDLVDLHALMAPRPVLVSGGTEDPPANWRALNHLIEVNRLLGYKRRVAMTSRRGHIPTPEALELELNFLEYWLKPE